MKDISALRLLYIVGSVALFIVGSVYLAVTNRMTIDEGIILILLDVIVCLVFVVVLLRRRLSGHGLYRGSSYSRLFFVLLFAWILLLIALRLPTFFAPAMILALLLVTILPGTIALGLCIYFNCLLCITGGLGTYSFYCYAILMVLGVWLGEYLKENNNQFRVLILLLLTACSFGIPVLFSYLSFFELTNQTLLYAGIVGGITLFFAWFVFNLLWRYFTKERVLSYEMILDEEYSIAKDFKSILPMEFKHAKKVSNLAGICAQCIHADELVARAGGLYYHAFHIKKESNRDALLKQMNHQCFPQEVIAIMEEHGGTERKPQTKESAIVHLTDSVVTKFEALQSESISSDWNQSMIIYQTVNELSSSGIYDESGLGMNEFLSIRECLAKESRNI